MKVLLVYPDFPDTYWGFRHALSIAGKRSAYPPLGLLTLSPMLPDSWERRLVDMNVRKMKPSDIAWADMVFISAMQIQKESLFRVMADCKQLGKRVVVGGPYTSICGDRLRDADHIFIGEAETTIPVFIRDLDEGRYQQIYKGAERPPLSLCPVPDFALADLTKYTDMSVQYSRGCPFQCEFCDIIEIYGRSPRTKSNAQMLAEFDALYQLGWRGDVFVVDDNFIGNKKNVKLLLPELAEWNVGHDYPFSFTTEASINIADDDELLEMMRVAGFRRVFIGIETPVESSLKEARKGQNTRRNLIDSVRKVQRAGQEVMAGFIVGFDNDPEDIFEKQIEFIRESAIPLAMVSLLVAIPETQLWRRLEREGRLIGVDHSGNNTECMLNFRTRMDPQRLLEGYKLIVNTIYHPAEYYRRALGSLAEVTFNSSSGYQAKFSFADVRVLLRLFFVLGLRDRARFGFWKFLTRVLRDHRDRFEQGMVLAAMGYHFRKLTETYNQ